MSLPFTQELFEEKFTKTPNECWEWTAVKNQDGYGRVRRFGKLESAHRVSYELYKGDLNGLHVCHTCDNPGCVNPDHLWLGTHADNQRDKKEKKRGVANLMPGVSHPSHKLTENDVVFIRSSSQTQSELGKQFKVSPSLIGAIKLQKRWKHI